MTSRISGDPSDLTTVLLQGSQLAKGKQRLLKGAGNARVQKVAEKAMKAMHAVDRSTPYITVEREQLKPLPYLVQQHANYSRLLSIYDCCLLALHDIASTFPAEKSAIWIKDLIFKTLRIGYVTVMNASEVQTKFQQELHNLRQIIARSKLAQAQDINAIIDYLLVDTQKAYLLSLIHPLINPQASIIHTTDPTEIREELKKHLDCMRQLLAFPGKDIEGLALVKESCYFVLTCAEEISRLDNPTIALREWQLAVNSMGAAVQAILELSTSYEDSNQEDDEMEMIEKASFFMQVMWSVQSLVEDLLSCSLPSIGGLKPRSGQMREQCEKYSLPLKPKQFEDPWRPVSITYLRWLHAPVTSYLHLFQKLDQESHLHNISPEYLNYIQNRMSLCLCNINNICNIFISQHETSIKQLKNASKKLSPGTVLYFIYHLETLYKEVQLPSLSTQRLLSKTGVPERSITNTYNDYIKGNRPELTRYLKENSFRDDPEFLAIAQRHAYKELFTNYDFLLFESVDILDTIANNCNNTTITSQCANIKMVWFSSINELSQCYYYLQNLHPIYDEPFRRAITDRQLQQFHSRLEGFKTISQLKELIESCGLYDPFIEEDIAQLRNLWQSICRLRLETPTISSNAHGEVFASKDLLLQHLKKYILLADAFYEDIQEDSSSIETPLLEAIVDLGTQIYHQDFTAAEHPNTTTITTFLEALDEQSESLILSYITAQFQPKKETDEDLLDICLSISNCLRMTKDILKQIILLEENEYLSDPQPLSPAYMTTLLGQLREHVISSHSDGYKEDDLYALFTFVKIQLIAEIDTLSQSYQCSAQRQAVYEKQYLYNIRSILSLCIKVQPLINDKASSSPAIPALQTVCDNFPFIAHAQDLIQFINGALDVLEGRKLPTPEPEPDVEFAPEQAPTTIASEPVANTHTPAVLQLDAAPVTTVPVPRNLAPTPEEVLSSTSKEAFSWLSHKTDSDSEGEYEMQIDPAEERRKELEKEYDYLRRITEYWQFVKELNKFGVASARQSGGGGSHQNITLLSGFKFTLLHGTHFNQQTARDLFNHIIEVKMKEYASSSSTGKKNEHKHFKA